MEQLCNGKPIPAPNRRASAGECFYNITLDLGVYYNNCTDGPGCAVVHPPSEPYPCNVKLFYGPGCGDDTVAPSYDEQCEDIFPVRELCGCIGEGKVCYSDGTCTEFPVVKNVKITGWNVQRKNPLPAACSSSTVSAVVNLDLLSTLLDIPIQDIENMDYMNLENLKDSKIQETIDQIKKINE
jgi:hypothetical protein